MNRFCASAMTLIVAATPSYSQEQIVIPDEVTIECMAKNDASRLPDCLKEGAFGYRMLKTAVSSEFFGQTATPAVDQCTEKNESYQSAWSCFSVAVTSAVETRRLVGLDKISDQCVAAISDGDVAEKLDAEAKSLRKSWFPKEFFSGGNTYRPFKGCQD